MACPRVEYTEAGVGGKAAELALCHRGKMPEEIKSVKERLTQVHSFGGFSPWLADEAAYHGGRELLISWWEQRERNKARARATHLRTVPTDLHPPMDLDCYSF